MVEIICSLYQNHHLIYSSGHLSGHLSGHSFPISSTSCHYLIMSEYSRSALQSPRNVYPNLIPPNGTDHQANGSLYPHLTLPSSPTTFPKPSIFRVQSQVEQTEQQMKENIEKIMAREESLDVINLKSDQLNDQSQQFNSQTQRFKWHKLKKYRYFLLILLIILFLIILWFIWIFQGFK